MAFNKEVEKEGTGNNPIELEYKLTCDKDYIVEATLSPATASSWVSIVGGGNKEGVFEIRISKNDGSSRNVSVYPRIYDNEHKLVSECTSKGVFISQKGDGGSSECSFEITITNPSGGRFKTCDAGTLSFDYVKKGESPSPEPTGDDLTGHCSVSIQNNTSNDFTITNKVVIYVTNRETQQPCYNGVFLYLNGREEDSSTYFLQRNAGLEFTGVFVKSNSTDPVINQDICLLCGERKVKLYQTNGEDIEWAGINHPHIIGTNVKLTDGGSYTIRIDSSCT